MCSPYLDSRPTSDHIPYVLHIGTNIPKSKIFRFENYQADHPGFLELIQFPLIGIIL
jgi:hypothetical protein